MVGSGCIVRDRSAEPIVARDLENGISQAIWKAFDAHRGFAAKKMNIAEKNVFIARVKMLGVKIDGYRVINPEGFSGRMIEFQILLTLVEKNDVLQPAPLDANTILAYAHMRKNNESAVAYVSIGDEESALYVGAPSETKQIATFAWGNDDFEKDFCAAYKIDGLPFRDIWGKYIAGETSAHLREKIYSVCNATTKRLIDLIGNAVCENQLAKTHRIAHWYLDGGVFPAYMYTEKQQVHTAPVYFKKAEKMDAEFLLYGGAQGSAAYDALTKIASRRVRWLMQ